MDDTRYVVEGGLPGADEYVGLRAAAGLSRKSRRAAEAGLPNSCHCVTVRLDGELVGMGRIVGDGGLFFQLVDIAVAPAHQGRGLGKAIVGALVDYLRPAVAGGAYVSLIADGDARHLYAGFGFVPTAPASIGMALATGGSGR